MLNTKITSNMAKSLRIPESKFLERSRTALTNAEANVEIKTALADYGMDTAKIAEGKNVYENTKAVWDLHTKEDAETAIASHTFTESFNELQALFKRHRDHTQTYFKKHPDVLVSLGVKGEFPRKYNEFFDKVDQYYSTIQSTPAIQEKMNVIKINETVVASCIAKFKALLADRSNFDKEIGESQNVTKSKNAALFELKDWMDDFDALAKVALYDKPQLLEILGIFVRS